MNRTRDLPVFPLSPAPVRSDVSSDAELVHHEFDVVGAADGPLIALVTPVSYTHLTLPTILRV